MSAPNQPTKLLLPVNSRARRITIHCVNPRQIEAGLKPLSKLQKNWVTNSGFTGKAGALLALPDKDGSISAYLFGLGSDEVDPFLFGKLAGNLPGGTYEFSGELEKADLSVLAWLLGSYRFSRYTPDDRVPARLICPGGVNHDEVLRVAAAVFFTRDLVNTPANDMGPADLSDAARGLARRHKAAFKTITGEKLLKDNFPLIHAVGRASDRIPRLIDIKWGNSRHPKVTLIGKGVCFDTGGLDLKPSSAMALMKKDMGGAANVFGLADMIMSAKLNIRLRVLVPAVENAVSANAFRPGDVLPSRKGLSVEIGNTDAEGRLVLADALAYADQEAPELLVDMATLTGAARVALGPDLPPFYTSDNKAASDLARIANETGDPLWRMPLWAPYDELLSSEIADVNHISSDPFAGSLTAALFLARFVENAKCYIHFDIYAWNPKARNGRPEGGEAQGIRTLFAFLKERYGEK